MYQLEDYQTALNFFHDFFSDKKYKWCLGASGALMVHGVNVQPKDIDIIVNIESINEVYKDLTSRVTSNIENTVFVNEEVKKFSLKVGVVPCEAVGFDITKDELINIEWHGLEIPVHKLEDELGFYLDRPEKQSTVKLIRHRIKELNDK